MTEDFRSDRMPTPEGKGNARASFERAWAAYARGANKIPLVQTVGQKFGGVIAVDLLGFWLTWQVEGGYEGLLRMGMSRSAIYRRLRLFRKVMGLHPDEYQLPGVTIDVVAYLAGSGLAK